MLDMGFIEDIEAILEETPKERQTALFSATFPPRINALVERYLNDPERITIKAEVRKTPRVRQVAYVVPRPHKLEALGRILDLESPASAIIFCRTRTEVDDLTEAMASRGYSPEALHGGFAQAQRDRVMSRFREGTADLLIATDVAARGLDIEHVSHVINYDIPQSPDVYVHRIGRTGRAGREGTAITLVQPREHGAAQGDREGREAAHRDGAHPDDRGRRARRIEKLIAALRETLSRKTRSMRTARRSSSLAEQFDPLDVAAAAAKLAGRGDAGGRRGRRRGRHRPTSPRPVRRAPAARRRMRTRTANAPTRAASGRAPRGAAAA